MRLSDIPINDMSQPNRIHIISFQSPYPANYGGAIERATLANKLIETKGLKQNAALMRIKRLVDKGELVAEGKMVRLPGGDSQIHAFTHSQGVGTPVNGVNCE